MQKRYSSQSLEFIKGDVITNSQAAAAGLRVQDIIIEINGTNVTGMSHHQVVQRLRAGGASTRLIVVDAKNKLSTIYWYIFGYISHFNNVTHYIKN